MQKLKYNFVTLTYCQGEADITNLTYLKNNNFEKVYILALLPYDTVTSNK